MKLTIFRENKECTDLLDCEISHLTVLGGYYRIHYCDKILDLVKILIENKISFKYEINCVLIEITKSMPIWFRVDSH